jgi:NAD(P)-dependent dehydrogenase (short-subunit alcohol dehydrogenase family)
MDGVDRSLAGRVAIVTGSGHGLGRAIAAELAAQGARLVLNGRAPGPVEQAAAELTARGTEVAVCLGDVRQSSTAQALARTALERWGRIDVLVNNAGTNVIKPSVELTDDEWHDVLETDLSAPFFCSRAVAPTMLAQGSGSIVNVSSILGLVGFPMRAAYASAKHGLIGLTKVLAAEWGPQGVRVNAICPGMVPVSERNRAMMRVSDEVLINRTPLRRFGRPEEIGKLVAYLASDAAGFVSGAVIAIDGGWTAYGMW